jgi:hypothetical protein
MESEQILDFIRLALSAEPGKNKLVEEYWDLLNTKYSEFARDDDAHDDDAAMLKKMQEAGRKFEEIARFKSIKGKRLGAIGGQFSSGKSAFINSLMLNTSIRLKTDMKPTTAIPTYVCCSNQEKPSITGYSYIGSNSARFDVPVETFESIDHDFLGKLQFNLKNIIPYITVSCPMKEEHFGKICLIDTPGYNPAGSGFSFDDYNTAIQHIATADFLIWIINIQNGTIDRDDLAILKKLRDEEKLRDLYIIANQADSKTDADIDKILDSIEDELDDADLKYTGICAYSSGGLKQGTIFQTRGKGLYEFFTDHNFESRAYTELENSIDEVFDDYKHKLERQKTEFKDYLSLLRKIDLDWAGKDVDKDTSDIKKIQKYFSTDKIDKHLKTCEELRSEFLQIIERLDSVEKYAHIKTIPQLFNYLTPFEEKAKADSSAKYQKLRHTIKALELCLNMIYLSKFTIPVFEEMLKEAEHGNRLYLDNMSIWVLNSIAAIKKYQSKKQIDAEKKLKEICEDIANKFQSIVNDYFGENATLDGDYFFSDVRKNIFIKNETDLTTLSISLFYDLYKTHGGQQQSRRIV